MIYAELEYDQHYSEVHSPLVEYLTPVFPNLEHGHQGDSWIWVFEGDRKVTIDTFYSMTHQVKSEASNSLFAKKVIQALTKEFKVSVYDIPQFEPHE